MHLRSRRKWKPTACPWSRPPRSPGDKREGVPHTVERTARNLLAAAVPRHPSGFVAKVRIRALPKKPMATAAAIPGSFPVRKPRRRVRPHCCVRATQSADRQARSFRQAETQAPLGPEISRESFAAHETLCGHPDPQNPSPTAAPVPAPRGSCRMPWIPQETLIAFPWPSLARKGRCCNVWGWGFALSRRGQAPPPDKPAIQSPRPPAPFSFLGGSALLEADSSTERAQHHFRCCLAGSTHEGTARLHRIPGMPGLERKIVLHPAQHRVRSETGRDIRGRQCLYITGVGGEPIVAAVADVTIVEN